MSLTRPIAPLENPNDEEHRRQIAMRANACMPKDGTEGMAAPLLLHPFAVADLPDATLWTGATVYVSNESGGATIAFSNGAVWLRVQDRVQVS